MSDQATCVTFLQSRLVFEYINMAQIPKALKLKRYVEISFLKHKVYVFLFNCILIRKMFVWIYTKVWYSKQHLSECLKSFWNNSNKHYQLFERSHLHIQISLNSFWTHPGSGSCTHFTQERLFEQFPFVLSYAFSCLQSIYLFDAAMLQTPILEFL